MFWLGFYFGISARLYGGGASRQEWNIGSTRAGGAVWGRVMAGSGARAFSLETRLPFVREAIGIAGEASGFLGLIMRMNQKETYIVAAS